MLLILPLFKTIETWHQLIRRMSYRCSLGFCNINGIPGLITADMDNQTSLKKKGI